MLSLWDTDENEPERYPALRAVAWLLKTIAVITLLAAVFIALSGAAGVTGVRVVLALVAGIIAAVSIWASAEVLVVLLDIEGHARALRDRSATG